MPSVITVIPTTGHHNSDGESAAPVSWSSRVRIPLSPAWKYSLKLLSRKNALNVSINSKVVHKVLSTPWYKPNNDSRYTPQSGIDGPNKNDLLTIAVDLCFICKQVLHRHRCLFFLVFTFKTLFQNICLYILGLEFGHWEWEKNVKNQKWEWDLRIAKRYLENK